MALDPTIIIGGLKLLGGLIGGRKKKAPPMTPAQSIMSTATGVTDAARATGLNRLTLLGASSATAGAGIAMEGDRGPPPLASIATILGDFVEENYGKDAKDRREHNRLQNELLTLEVQKARTLNRVATPTMVGGAALSGGRVNVQTTGPIRAADGLIGPRRPVMVRNGLNGKWVNLDAGVADRLRIKAGETMIGEDNEALFGDVVSEGVNVGSIATGSTTGQPPIVTLPKPKPKIKPVLPDFKWPPRKTR